MFDSLKTEIIIGVILCALMGIGAGLFGHHCYKSGENHIYSLWNADIAAKIGAVETKRKADQAASDQANQDGIAALTILDNTESDIQKRDDHEKANNPVFYSDSCRLPDSSVQLYADAVHSSRPD